jgi:hypothetical protein
MQGERRIVFIPKLRVGGDSLQQSAVPFIPAAPADLVIMLK